jgi:diguanylate cyclase (GGDEF)-like protein
MGPAGGRDVSNTAVRILVEHLDAVGGADLVRRAFADAGELRPLPILVDDTEWSSYAEFRRILESAARALGGVEALHRVGFERPELDGGAMPMHTGELQALEDPKVLLSQVASGHNLLLPMAENEGEDAGPDAWLSRQRLRPEFEPYPELCAYTVGIAPMAPLLFGYPAATASEITCQLRGDEWCTTHIRWEPPDERQRTIDVLRMRLRVNQQQLDDFRATVTDLVRASDVEAVLEHILRAAAGTTRATGFVLAIEPLPAVSGRCWSRGVDDDEAEVIEAGLRSGEPVPGVRLVVQVTSPRRRYGWLAVYDPTGIDVVAADALQSYVDLAAMALDAAVDRWESHIEAKRARALLLLAESMVAATTTEAVAAALADAAPIVVGADRAMVVTYDEERRSHIAACAGYGAMGTHLLGRTFPRNDDLLMEISRVTPTMGTAEQQAVMQAAGSVAAVYVPIWVDDDPVALLIASVTSDPDRLAPEGELDLRLQGLAAQASTALRSARLVDRIRHEAEHDSLTGLPNRANLVQRAATLLSGQRRSDRPLALLFLDLDGFKDVNDRFGHAAGDALLRAAAKRFRNVLREHDVVGRFGGDEFVVLLDASDGSADPSTIAGRLVDATAEPFRLDEVDGPVRITASVGIAVADEHVTADELLRDADQALYLAKRSGKHQAVLYRRPVS